MLLSALALLSTVRGNEPVTVAGGPEGKALSCGTKLNVPVYEIPPWTTPFATVSLGAGLTNVFTAAFVPKIEVGYQLDPTLSFSVGISCALVNTVLHGIDKVAGVDETSGDPYTIKLSNDGTTMLAALPISADARYLWINDRHPVYFEVGIGYAIPLGGKEIVEHYESGDGSGNLFVADRKIRVRLSSLFVSSGIGTHFKNLELGLTLQLFPTSKFGSEEVNVNMRMPSGAMVKQESVVGQMPVVSSFLGVKVGYKFYIEPQKAAAADPPTL